MKHVDSRDLPTPELPDRGAQVRAWIRAEQTFTGPRADDRLGERHLVNRGAVADFNTPRGRATGIGSGASGRERGECFT